MLALVSDESGAGRVWALDLPRLSLLDSHLEVLLKTFEAVAVVALVHDVHVGNGDIILERKKQISGVIFQVKFK